MFKKLKSIRGGWETDHGGQACICLFVKKVAPIKNNLFRSHKTGSLVSFENITNVVNYF